MDASTFALNQWASRESTRRHGAAGRRMRSCIRLRPDADGDPRNFRVPTDVL